MHSSLNLEKKVVKYLMISGSQSIHSINLYLDSSAFCKYNFWSFCVAEEDR